MMAQASTARTMATTADRFLALSDDARRIYRHLLLCWLTVGETMWSRRHIHQDLKGARRFRRMAGLEPPLAELINAGLLAYSEAGPQLGLRSPRYALTEPYLLQGQRPPRRFSAVLAPALPVSRRKVPSPLSSAIPTETTQAITHAEEIAWRVDTLWDRARRTGRLESFLVREVPATNTGCPWCGGVLGPGDDRHCGYCLEALRIVLARYQAARR